MFLYKYLPLTWGENLAESEKELNEKRCQCIKGNTFWFSKPKDLNDPYECQPIYSNIKTLEDIDHILSNLSDEELAVILQRYPRCNNKIELVDLHRKIFNSAGTSPSIKTIFSFGLQSLASCIVKAKIANVGVLCLSSDYSSCLMWSHYAKNHEGICLEIDIPETTHSLKKVTYTPEQPIMALHEAMREKYGRIEDIFYTKSVHWEHECEWRMVSRVGGVAREIPDTKITRIFFGINTSDETREKISGLIGDNTPTSRMMMRKNYVLGCDT